MTVTLQNTNQEHKALTQQVVDTVRVYLAKGSKDVSNLYHILFEEIEASLFRTVMELTRYNQSRAARVLGVSRGTLRTKLKQYFDDEFIGTREA